MFRLLSIAFLIGLTTGADPAMAQAPLVRRISSPARHSVSGLMMRVGPTLSPVPVSIILPSLTTTGVPQPAFYLGHFLAAQLCCRHR